MTTYVIVRHGSNAANQSMCNRAVVGSVEAPTQDKAKAAMVGIITIYNNQYLEAIPWSHAAAWEKRDAEECDEMRDYAGRITPGVV